MWYGYEDSSSRDHLGLSAGLGAGRELRTDVNNRYGPVMECEHVDR